jgi:hypothetical protein
LFNLFDQGVECLLAFGQWGLVLAGGDADGLDVGSGHGCAVGLLSFDSTMGHMAIVRVIDAFPQFLAYFEVRQVFGRNLDRVSGFWIPALSGRPIVQGETPKSPDFDAITAYQGTGDRIQDQGYRDFRILWGELRGASG